MDYFQGFTAQQVLGIVPTKAGASAAGEQLPASSHMAGDLGAVPWSHQSQHFWFLALGAAAILGIVGASVDVRAGKRHARASVNDK
jgi:hypothetical protein